jgi:hypothetical protein
MNGHKRRLATLPFELRMIILEHLLVNTNNEPLSLRFNGKSILLFGGIYDPAFEETWSGASILLTCRQFREEGLQVMLARNVLFFTDILPHRPGIKNPTAFRRWTLTLPPTWLQHAKRVFLSYPYFGPCPGLHGRIGIILLLHYLAKYATRMDSVVISTEIRSHEWYIDTVPSIDHIDDVAPFAIPLLQRGQVKHLYLGAQAVYQRPDHFVDKNPDFWSVRQGLGEQRASTLVHGFSEEREEGLWLFNRIAEPGMHEDGPPLITTELFQIKYDDAVLCDELRRTLYRGKSFQLKILEGLFAHPLPADPFEDICIDAWPYADLYDSRTRRKVGGECTCNPNFSAPLGREHDGQLIIARHAYEDLSQTLRLWTLWFDGNKSNQKKITEWLSPSSE